MNDMHAGRSMQANCNCKAAASSSTECAVCLADFRHGERLRLLPARLPHRLHRRMAAGRTKLPPMQGTRRRP